MLINCHISILFLSGDHWSKSDLPLDFFDTAIEEWQAMVANHDVTDMMSKYTEDCITIYKDKVLYGQLGGYFVLFCFCFCFCFILVSTFGLHCPGPPRPYGLEHL